MSTQFPHHHHPINSKNLYHQEILIKYNTNGLSLINMFLLLLISLAQGKFTFILDDSSEVVPQTAIDYINTVQTSWVASKAWVGKMTVGEAKALANTIPSEPSSHIYSWGSLLSHLSIPSSFDSRTQWPGCVHPILDQGKCGSCWAFGASEAFSDRLCISSSGKINVVLSPQYLVNCDNAASGCNGGTLDAAWSFIQTNGIPTYNCVPYQGVDGTCSSRCSDGSAPVFYKTSDVYYYSGPDSIQTGIITSGPVETIFQVYQDFMSYTSGVYVHTWGNTVGAHAVKMLGWGVSSGTSYWICANSWGTSWGMQGYFWIAFGQCFIDNQAAAGTPIV